MSVSKRFYEEMNEDFACVYCGGDMVEVDGCYVCRECGWVNGSSQFAREQDEPEQELI